MTIDARPATVLLVEDDYFVRDLLEIGLAKPGRRVLVATSGAEALALGRPQHIDLLVADVILPDLSGPGVAAALRFKHPDMQILYISGWYDQPNFPDLEGEQLLMKPFGLDDLGSPLPPNSSSCRLTRSQARTAVRGCLVRRRPALVRGHPWVCPAFTFSRAQDVAARRTKN